MASQSAKNLKSDDASDALRTAIAICSLHCHLDACLNSGALREETLRKFGGDIFVNRAS